MAVEDVFNRFNRGEVDSKALARNDVTELIDSCQLMENFLPERLGPMSYRPGTEFIGYAADPTNLSANRALIPLTRSIGDTVKLEFSGTTMRPLIDGLPVAMSADTVAMPTVTAWTTLTGSPTNVARTSPVPHQRLQMEYGDSGYYVITGVTASTLQTLMCTCYTAPAHIRIGEGSSSNANDLVDMTLYPGQQVLCFTPTTTSYTITVSSIGKEFGNGKPRASVGLYALTAGNLEFTVPDADYRKISYDTSADVMFLALGSNNAPRIVRRGANNTFTFEDYFFIDGPYMDINGTEVGCEFTGYNSITTLTSDADLFHGSDFDWLNSLVKVAQPERVATFSFGATGDSDQICAIGGFGDNRDVFINIVGGSGTVVLQRWDDKLGSYVDVRTFVSTSFNTSEIVSDRNDGIVTDYRFSCTAYTSGTIKTEIKYVYTGMAGVGKITAQNNASSIFVNLLRTPYYAGTEVTPSVYWYLGAWRMGKYPQGVTIYEGRVVWASKNRVDMTKIDDYYSFDDEEGVVTDAISKTIGFGPVDDISWVESTNGLMLGLPTTEVLIRSDNYDSPLTPLNTNLKPHKGGGCAAVRALPVDDDIYYVTRDSKKISRIVYQAGQGLVTSDQMLFHPSICGDGIDAIVCLRHPEKRLIALTTTGELRVLLNEPTEGVQGWARVTMTGGTVKDMCVVPQLGEDELWLLVERGGNVLVEKLSTFENPYPLDSCVTYASPATSAFTGLGHLEGETVHVYLDGIRTNTAGYTVASGAIDIGADFTGTPTQAIVGLKYTAQYTSNKLTQYLSNSRYSFAKPKLVSNIGLVLQNYIPGSLKYGRDFDHLLDLAGPLTGSVISELQTDATGFNGISAPDPRLYLQADGPVTVLGLEYQINVPKSTTQNG